MPSITNKFPKVSVKIVFRCGGHFLYYITKSGIRDIPGGHVNFGETILEALKRELKEELGYKLTKAPKFLDTWSYIRKDKNAHRIYFVFTLKLPTKNNFKSLEFGDDLEFIWLHKNQIKEQKFLPEMEALFLKVFKQRK
ncbi:MAG: hypothetical protein A3G04_03960 [Candidatus Taylorbacteria bacterium RIFCSPLOWO2_12_FULL_44_9]|nr:MAG: hypothetical protein A3G04_03960 [Candidatus Taylorbacteria bacterium RIFCSPLOWO2_12_FULL_44_9]